LLAGSTYTANRVWWGGIWHSEEYEMQNKIWLQSANTKSVTGEKPRRSNIELAAVYLIQLASQQLLAKKKQY
jgi:hypothetical protein